MACLSGGAHAPDAPCRYYLATAAQDNAVKIWDLRKLSNLITLDLPFSALTLAFDYSGSYLAVGGASLRCGSRPLPIVFLPARPFFFVAAASAHPAFAAAARRLYGTKTWEKVAELAHPKEVTGVVFGPNASFVATASADRSLRVFGAA